MKQRLAALTAVAVIASGLLGPAAAADPGDDLPDPCTLLSEEEVVDLTGREIVQIDEDGYEPGESGTRFCQWQQEGGQLVVFLSPTTAEDFEVTPDEAEWLDEDAFWLAGHLFVRHDTVQVDVYSRGGSDARNLADAMRVVEKLIDRI